MDKYLDFKLLISAGNGTEYQITVVDAAAGGEPTLTTRIPVDDEMLRGQLRALVDARSAQVSAQRSTSHDRNLRLSSGPPPSFRETTAAREIGERLFDALIVGTVRDAYTSSLVRARAQNAGLRLRLRIDAPEVAALPWEFLYSLDEGDHVSLLCEIPLTRYTQHTRDYNTLDVTPPLRILGMVSCPTDLPALNVDQEKLRIERALEHLLREGDVELDWVEGGTWKALQTKLDSNEWHVFHFIGHGTFDAEVREGQLAFCNDQGMFRKLSAANLGATFSGHHSLRLAILNACEGGRTSNAEIFSSVGAALTRRGVPAVISMQFDISDQAALEFSRFFYDSMARRNPVDVAVTQARLAVRIHQPDHVEWATPMLHMHSLDGKLFTIGKKTSTIRKPTFVPQPYSTPTLPSSVNPQLQSGIAILRRKVHEFWIDDFLQNSLFLQMQYDLKLETTGGAVNSPWAAYFEKPSQHIQSIANEQSITDIFDTHGSILILGEPGSGKTTLLLILLDLLIERFDNSSQSFPSEKEKVPAVFNLSSWSPKFSELEEWLAAQMSRQYKGIPRIAIEELLKSGYILPLLDGLDEISKDKRPQCVEAINSYMLKRNWPQIVVCCRFKEYMDLSTPLRLNTAVNLEELSDEQVDDYLATGGEQLAGLRDLLRRESTLRIDARLPLWLNLMVRAYHGLSVVDLDEESDGSARERRRQLMNAYMARMYRHVREGREW